MLMIKLHSAIFAWFLCSFGPHYRALVAYHLVRGVMPLHNAVWVKFNKGATTDIREQVPSKWAKGCMLVNCACLI